jgi:hypothetical protein
MYSDTSQKLTPWEVNPPPEVNFCKGYDWTELSSQCEKLILRQK